MTPDTAKLIEWLLVTVIVLVAVVLLARIWIEWRE